MKINIIGKAHREGVAKRTGNPYNFYQVHYTGPNRGVEGLASLILNLAPSLIPYADIKLNAEYEVEFNNRGYVSKYMTRPCFVPVEDTSIPPWGNNE